MPTLRKSNSKAFWSVIDKSGQTSVNSTPIDAHLLGIYFATLFKKSDGSTNNDSLVDKITNTDLDKLITSEGIINVLSNLKDNKAPGLDGITGIVYKMFH